MVERSGSAEEEKPAQAWKADANCDVGGAAVLAAVATVGAIGRREPVILGGGRSGRGFRSVEEAEDKCGGAVALGASGGEGVGSPESATEL